jgi:hypothetical protein
VIAHVDVRGGEVRQQERKVGRTEHVYFCRRHNGVGND